VSPGRPGAVSFPCEMEISVPIHSWLGSGRPEVVVVGRLAEVHNAYAGLVTDVRFVRRLFAHLRRPDTSSGLDGDLPEVLFQSAVVAYGRCFVGGRWKRYADDVSPTDDVLQEHRWLLKQRHRFVAHVDKQGTPAQHFRTVILLDNGQPGDVVGAQLRLEAPGPEHLDRLERAPAFFEDQFDRRRAAAAAEVRAALRELPHEQLYEVARMHREIRLDVEADSNRR
jgi:hypothetical protein